MKLLEKIAAITFTACCATAAWSEDYQVTRSLELTSQGTEVWSLIGDFCDIDDWHPNVTACSLKVMDGSLVRVLVTKSEDEIVQKRIAEEPGLSYTYKTVSSSLPIQSFVATLSIEPFDKPLISWSGRFSSDDPTVEQLIVDEFESGIAAIATVLNSRQQ